MYLNIGLITTCILLIIIIIFILPNIKVILLWMKEQDIVYKTETETYYDWEVKETGISHAGICRRFWFVKKLRKENG